jgi:hypothetical protein
MYTMAHVLEISDPNRLVSVVLAVNCCHRHVQNRAKPKHTPFSSTFLCLSRACLGKKIAVCIKKHRQKGIFRTAQSLQRKFRCQAAARAASCSAARRMPSHLIVIDGRRMHTGGHTTQTYRHKKSAVSERLEHLFSASFLCRNGLVAVEKAAQTVHAANSSQSSPVG